MERSQTIVDFRAKLDKTLASPGLVNKECIKKLVTNQLLRSETQGINDVVVEKRSKQVMEFLGMLRSASGNDHSKASTRNDWKVKEDNEAYRVMYREGLQGTPFHTLLIEGHVDAPADVGLSAAWETSLYRKWWPHLNVPTFKIAANHCLKKIAINEHISLVRLKLLWPLSARELILHYFEVEYFEDDFVILLINTISDTENISEKTHGFTTEGIPEAKDIVRMGFLGGTCMKKVSPNKTYFRTVGNLDMKLDFVPAWLINFIARQLMGGACKLYQKVVPEVAQVDDDFGKALQDTIYVRIREALYSDDIQMKNGQVNGIESDKFPPSIAEKREMETKTNDTIFKCQASRPDNLLIVESTSQILEIQENKGEKPADADNGEEVEVKKTNVSKNKQVYISEEVQGALRILDNVIEMVHTGDLSKQTCIGLYETPHHNEVQSLQPAVITKVESNYLIDEALVPSGATEIENIETGLDESHKPDTTNYRSMGSVVPESKVLRNQIAPATSPLQDCIVSTKDADRIIAQCSPLNESNLINLSKDYKEDVGNVNEGLENYESQSTKKNSRFACCHSV